MSIFSFILLFFLSFSVFAENKIIILHSYDSENIEEKIQRETFLKNLSAKTQVGGESLSATKVNYHDNYKKMFYEYIKKKYFDNNNNNLVFLQQIKLLLILHKNFLNIM